jgi:hypothetical protein
VDFFGDADVDTMLADWGHSITIAGVTRPCLFDERDAIGLEQDGGAGQIMRVAVATIKTSDFPNVMNDDACVVDGVSYTVWRRLRQGDGAITELLLRKV